MDDYGYGDDPFYPGGGPPDDPYAPPPEAPPSAPPGYSISGNPSAALIQALYPGYEVKNGQFVYTGQGSGSIANQPLAAQYLNSLWSPLSGGNYQGFWNALGITGGDARPDVLGTYENILKGAGFGVNRNASGAISGKITLPNGHVIDVGNSFGTNDPKQMKWQWLDTANASPNGMPGASGSWTEPWTEPFVPPDWTGGPYKPPNVPAYPDFQTPDAFKAPDANAVLEDPGFKLREQEGADILSNAAGASGRLREGGFLKELLKYGQMFGSTEYGNVYNRRASEYDRNYQDLLQGYTTNRDTVLGRFGLEKGNYDSLWGAKNTARDRAYNEYLDRYKIFKENQDRPFDKYYRTTSLGQQAAQ